MLVPTGLGCGRGGVELGRAPASSEPLLYGPALRDFGLPFLTGSSLTDLDIDRFSHKLVRDASDAIVYAAADGIIRFWNGGAERIFGYEESEALGASLDIIVPENLRKAHWNGYRETMRTGQTRYAAGDILAVPALRKDGTRISVEFTILPFHAESGEMAGIAAMLRDVSERFEEMKALRKQAARASQA